MLRTVGRNKPVYGRFRQEHHQGAGGLLCRKRPPDRAYYGLRLVSFVTSVSHYVMSFCSSLPQFCAGGALGRAIGWLFGIFDWAMPDNSPK